MPNLSTNISGAGAVAADSLTVAGAIVAGTTVTAGTGITTTTGNITAAGAVAAGTTVTAGTGIVATTGNVTATAGAVAAGTTVTAGTGITATTGNVAATAGRVTAAGFTSTTDGSPTTPAYGFSSATGLGHYAAGGANKVITATAGGGRLEVSTTAVEAINQASLSGSGALLFTTQLNFALTANQDNWAPSLGTFAPFWRVTPDAARNITGIATPGAGRILVIQNTGAFNITLVEQATSTAANQIITPAAANLVITPGGAGFLIYDGSASRWRAHKWF